MDFYYTSYFWNVRTHRRTGKILDQGWKRWSEYESEQEALADLQQDRKEFPNHKFMLIKEAREVLFNDLETAE